MGINPWHHQCVYLFLLNHIKNMSIDGGPKDHWNSNWETGQVQDNKSYLVLIITWNSFYLNPYNDIAKGLCEGVSQTCKNNSSPYKVCNQSYI